MEYSKKLDSAIIKATNIFNEKNGVENKVRTVHRALGEAGCYRDIYSNNGSADPEKLYALMHALVTRLSPGVSASIMVMINTILPVLLKHANQTSKNVSDGMLDGTLVAAFAVTEPAGGSFVFDVLNTNCEKISSGYRIDGEKRYITNGHFADVLLVLAKSAQNKNKWTNCSLFAIPGSLPGITRSELAKHGLIDSPISSIRFDNLIVPHELCIAHNSGAIDIFNAISKERSIIGVASLIVAEAAILLLKKSLDSEVLTNVSQSRVALSNEWLELLLGRVSYLNSYRNIAMEDQEKALVSSISKYKLAKGAEDIIGKVWEIAQALPLKSDVIRVLDSFHKDSKVFQIFAGTSDVMLDLIFDLTKTLKPM
ncbi:MAG: hypothetical protein B0W54_21495 [Cellvibrio sp. 79]|nr:MAG: hypothetical protein B0W54_21495 [Cellvibrio sp. 79]